MIGVLCKDYKEFLTLLKKRNVTEDESKEYFFIASVASLTGRKIDQVIEYGTYYTRRDHHEIQHQLEYIRRYHNNCLILSEKDSMGVLNMVERFHLIMDQPILDSPQIPNSRKDFRVSLITEETKELIEALDKGDLVETADALGDLLYVVLGFALEAGLKNSFPAIFAEIQRSNLSKTCETAAEAEATVEKYKAEGVEVYFKEKAKRYIIYRTSDDKVLKGINYSKPNIKGIIDQYS